ncbi:MAG: STAS domain-containing protein [Chloroflexaceae bacterium]|nr:STAS domain-containing protein [Chloroflexaceae bacterium]NJO07301.1 STAS domain-containing protein [Chloroflexaceae bacterium]
MNLADDVQRMQLLNSILDNLPAALSVYQPDGLLVYANRAFSTMVGVELDLIIRNYNALLDPRYQYETPSIASAFERVLNGEVVIGKLTDYNLSESGYATSRPITLWFRSVLFPIYDATGTAHYVGSVLNDVTEHVEQQQALEMARRELREQQTTIQELSSPVVQVWEGIVLLPMVGAVDAQRAIRITEDLLEAVVRHQAEHVIIDVTGVTTFDTQVANYLLLTIKACHLLGCEVVLVGISMQAAQTIVHLGLSLNEITTYADLQAGLAWAFKQQGLMVTVR